MSHKVHPKAFKVREIKDWSSRGFYNNKNTPLYLEEDFRIREFLKKKLPQGVVEDIEIERTATILKVIIKTSRPALVIGRGGKGGRRSGFTDKPLREETFTHRDRGLRETCKGSWTFICSVR